MDKDLACLNTPKLIYLAMKRSFLQKFLDRKAWGEFGSKQQLVAVSGLLDYYQKTKSLSEEFPQLKNDVIIDNKNVVLEGILPLPLELREQLIMAAVEEGYQLDWPASHILASMEKFLGLSGCLRDQGLVRSTQL